MYSYVGFLNGRLNISSEDDSYINRSRAGRKNESAFCGEPSFYACQDVFSTVTPDDIPQPAGKVITDEIWERLMQAD